MGERSIDAKPYRFILPGDERAVALLVIDMQRDFLEPGGFGAALGNDVASLKPAIPVIENLLAHFRQRTRPIIHTKEGHRPDLSDCPPAQRRRGREGTRIGDLGPMGRILVLGEWGNEIIDELRPAPGEVVLSKPGKGAFFATALDETLRARRVTHLILTGVTTEVCVQSTMREANDRGYECLLVEDATASYFPEFKAATLAMIRAQGGIVGATATSGAVMEAL